MKHSLARHIALGLLAPIALGMPARAQAPVDNQEIRAAAAAFDAAQYKGDGATLEAMLAPDFLYARGSGKIGGKRDFIEGFTTPGHVLEPFRITDPLFIRVSPDAAIVGGEAWLKGTDGGKPFVQHFRYADTFAKRDGRWVVVYMQITGLPM